MLRVLPVIAVFWEDLAGVGNVLGLCTADILPLWAVVCPLVVSYCEYSQH